MGRCPFHNGETGGTDKQTSENEPTDRRSEGPSGGGRDRGSVSRRDFVRSALLMGGAGALSGLSDLFSITASARSPGERRDDADRVGVAARENRQHAWNAFDGKPSSMLILTLDYVAEGEPTPGHRRQVAEALREIERHFAWGAEGVLFTMAYSASYFDRFDEDPPAGAAPWAAERVVEEASALTPYDPEPDTADAVLLLASTNPANVLAVESALWGENGPDVPNFSATFEGVFERPRSWPDRRVGESGAAFQDTESEYEEFLSDDVEDDIPNESPLSMGFVAGFAVSIPGEDAVTLERGQRFPGSGIDADHVPTDLSYVGEVGERDPGVFAEGTLKHLSYLTIDLDEWYSVDRDRRRHQMYSPYHGEAETTTNDEKLGNELLADGSKVRPGTEDLVSREEGTLEGEIEEDPVDGATVYGKKVDKTAKEAAGEADEPTTGHSQKAARARYDIDDDGEVEQPCLRRDWDGIRPQTPEYERKAGYHFNVPMRFNESIMTLLDANYGPDFTSLDGRINDAVDAASETKTDGERNGLVPFLEATRRNNWLVPPIRLRALPHPRADSVDIAVESSDGEYAVTVSDGGNALDTDTVRFGSQEQVDKARGASPTNVDRRGRGITFTFDAEHVDGDADTFALFAKRQGSRKPVTGQADAV
ncbi:MAG: hypothetical protein ABEI98_03420 [Halorhabdus sp.]